MGLQVEIRQSGDVTILDLQGRLTIGTANDSLSASLRQSLEGGAKKLLINFSGVNQIDSSGISTVVRTFVSLSRTGGALKMMGASGRVHDVLEVTRLLSSIPHFASEQDAVRSFS
ncbi:MAG: STAS domain-containing protein [Acidobacteria bacterium]|nr:STAS domain-containing protein [Acidobacteriota bacterium]